MEALSQSEIDALLSQTQPQEGQEESEIKRNKVVFGYNFRKQKKFSKGQFVLLESIHKRFLRNVEVTLTNLLSQPVMATLAAATELTYRDCRDSFTAPTCLYLLNINEGGSKFLLEIDPNLAFFFIDKILGGTGKDSFTMDRELSLIEERIMSRLVSLFNHDLKEAWERIETMEIETESFYSQADYIQVFGDSDAVILISMDVRSSDKVLGYLNLCLPSSFLERQLQISDKSFEDMGHSDAQNENDRFSLESRLRNSVIPVRAILGQTKMLVNDLLHLKNGDVIFLHSRVNRPIDIFVGDMRLYKGRPIKKESYMAVKISNILRQLQ